jgi:hypothetical protein
MRCILFNINNTYKKDNKILLLNQINDNKSIFSIDKKIETSLNKNQNNYFYKNIR